MNEASPKLPTLVLSALLFLLLVSPTVGAQSWQEGVFLDKSLTFINQAANRLGDWMVTAINRMVGKDVAGGLQVPLGYLSVLTLALVAFGLLEAARKLIWLIVGIGWGLLIIRIILEVLAGPAEP